MIWKLSSLEFLLPHLHLLLQLRRVGEQLRRDSGEVRILGLRGRGGCSPPALEGGLAVVAGRPSGGGGRGGGEVGGGGAAGPGGGGRRLGEGDGSGR